MGKFQGGITRVFFNRVLKGDIEKGTLKGEG